MKIVGLLLAFFNLSAIISFGQTAAAKYYCQDCCSGVNVYYLKLSPDSKFELYYYTKNRKRDRRREDSTFGFGEFDDKNDVLTLSFKNVPAEKIEAKKTKTSDSLIVHFYVFDNIREDSMALVNVKLPSGKELFYTDPTGTIKTSFNGPAVINFSSIAFKDLNYTFTEPGEYEIRVGLNPEGTWYLKKGDRKEFRRMRSGSEEWFEYTVNENLKFTTRSCGR
jgi:hypothetical protein